MTINKSNINKAKILREMLKHFEDKHNDSNHALYTTGEGKRCSPFEKTLVSDVKSYIEAIIWEDTVHEEILTKG